MPKYLETKKGSLESAVLEAVSRAQQAAIAISKKEKEEESKQEVKELAGTEVANRMRKITVMKPFADKVAKMKTVSRDDLEKLLPDYVSGHHLTAVLKEEESVSEGYSAKQYKMAFGVLNDPRWKGGNMTKIVDTIEKIAKGLSKDKAVANAIRLTNEGKDISEIEKQVEEELTAKQKKIDLNKNGKVDGDDLKKLRAKSEETKVECPKCKGEGCGHCDGKGYHITEELSLAELAAKHISDMWHDAAKKKKKEEVETGGKEQKKTMTGKPMSNVEVSPKDKVEK